MERKTPEPFLPALAAPGQLRAKSVSPSQEQNATSRLAPLHFSGSKTMPDIGEHFASSLGRLPGPAAAAPSKRKSKARNRRNSTLNLVTQSAMQRADGSSSVTHGANLQQTNKRAGRLTTLSLLDRAIGVEALNGEPVQKLNKAKVMAAQQKAQEAASQARFPTIRGAKRAPRSPEGDGGKGDEQLDELRFKNMCANIQQYCKPREQRLASDIGVIGWVLKKMSSFLGRSRQDLVELLAQVVEVEALPRVTTIFREGDIGTKMYFIITGKVEILTTRDGKEVVLNELSRGASFGEVALMSANSKRVATVRTVTNSEFLTVTESDFKSMMDSVKITELTEKKRFLQEISVFAEDLKENPECLDHLGLFLRPERCPKGSVIFPMMTESIYLIRSGECRVLMSEAELTAHDMKARKPERKAAWGKDGDSNAILPSAGDGIIGANVNIDNTVTIMHLRRGHYFGEANLFPVDCAGRCFVEVLHDMEIYAVNFVDFRRMVSQRVLDSMELEMIMLRSWYDSAQRKLEFRSSCWPANGATDQYTKGMRVKFEELAKRGIFRPAQIVQSYG